MGGNRENLFTKGTSFYILSKEYHIGNPEYEYLTLPHIFECGMLTNNMDCLTLPRPCERDINCKERRNKNKKQLV